MKKTVALILALSLVFLLSGCDSADYSKAEKLMEQGDYTAASEAFRALGDYKESVQNAAECDYRLAMADFDAGNYETAKAAFETLGDYSDAAEYVVLAQEKIIGENILGEWTMEDYDISESVLAGLEQTAGDLLDFIEIGSFPITVHMSITDKNTFSVALDKDTFLSSFETVMQSMQDGLVAYCMKYYEETLREAGYTMEDLYADLGTEDPEEIIYQLEGYYVEELIEAFGLESMITSLVDSAGSAGTYEIAGDQILLYSGTTTEYGSLDMEAGTLTIGSAEINGQKTTEGYPQVFVRTK